MDDLTGTPPAATELTQTEIDLIVAKTRIDEAVNIGLSFGDITGGDHKMWVIDQMLRSLLGLKYQDKIKKYREGKDEWDEGIAPFNPKYRHRIN